MLEARGAEKVSLSDITRDDQAEAVEDAFRYDRLVLMSSSYDGGVFPPMEELLMHLRDKTYRNRKIAIVENGSWAPSAARVIKGYVEKFKDITLVEPVVTIKSALNAESEKALEELADALTAK
jgi:flavorubredoxin